MYIFININIFCQLKLNISPAIPAAEELIICNKKNTQDNS